MGEKIAGRAKGTPNKATVIGKEFIMKYLTEHKEDFEEMMSNLDADKYVQAYITMMKFIVPQMQAVKMEDADKDENGYKKVLIELRQSAEAKKDDILQKK